MNRRMGAAFFMAYLLLNRCAGARRPLHCMKSRNSSSQCSNPRASQTPAHLGRNRSGRRSIVSQRQPQSNGPRNGHRRFLRRPWRAPSGSMREAIVPDAHGPSPPPRTCTIYMNDRREVAENCGSL